MASLDSVSETHSDAASEIARKKIRQVFEFVRAMHERKNPVIREVSDATWHHVAVAALPQHAAVRLIDVDAITRWEAEVREAQSSDEPGSDADSAEDELSSEAGRKLLTIGRPHMTEPPEAGEDLQPWITPEWLSPMTRRPEFLKSLQFPKTKLNANELSAESRSLIDDPVLVAQSEAYRSLWEKWAASERPARDAIRFFEHFYEIHNFLNLEAENYDLMLADGMLVWQRPNGSIRYPLIARKLTLEFNPEVPQFTLSEDAPRTEFADGLFRGVDEVDGQTVALIRADCDASNPHPLLPSANEFLQRAVTLLSSRGLLFNDHIPAYEAVDPVVGRGAIIFLRPKTQGVAAALDRVIEDVKSGAELPMSLCSIVGALDVVDEQAASGNGDGGAVIDANEDGNVLFTKPGNAEQLSIARKLFRNSSVLVQGPPGTGKTHTIANLLGHLLAQGKSVLVTSHTTKALSVLREKVAPALQPLCLAVLNESAKDRAVLSSSVAGIADRLANSDPDILNQEAERLESRRSDMLTTIRGLRARLLRSRQHEIAPILCAGKSFTPIDAAKFVHAHEADASFIPGSIELDIPLPMRVDEFDALYASNGVISPEDEACLGGVLPDITRLATASAFAALVDELRAIDANDLSGEQHIWSETARESGDCDILQTAADSLKLALTTFDALPTWAKNVSENGSSFSADASAAEKPWRAIIAEVESAKAKAHETLMPIFDVTPVFSDPHDIFANAAAYKALCAHVAATGKKPGSLTLLLHPDWKRASENVRVAGGAAPTTPAHFAGIHAAIEIACRRSELARRWNTLFEPIDGPSISAPKYVGSDPSEEVAAKFVPVLIAAVEWKREQWNKAVKLLESSGLDWCGIRSQLDIQKFELSELDRVLYAARELLPNILARELGRRRRIILQGQILAVGRAAMVEGVAAAVTVELWRAIETRNAELYNSSLSEIARLHSVDSAVRLRQSRLAVLAVHAPSWAEKIRGRVGVHGQIEPPGDVTTAWLWSQLRDELDRRDGDSEDDLLRKLDSERANLRETTAQLVECKAWSAQAKRTTGEQAQALKTFAAIKKKIGAGTGKNVGRWRALERESMIKSRPAVPVWIMPLATVAESVPPQSGIFDVVIVDEASQSDVTGLLALYLGKKVVVVGDMKQVTPLDVGASIDVSNKLADSFLQGVRNRQLYDGKQSLYGLAEQSFDGVVALREHFRCVPEIIAYSNREFYEGTIVPLRERGPYALPVVEHCVSSAGVVHDINEDEARAVVALVAAACEQPEYATTPDGNVVTFGIISMVKDAQSKRMQVLLPLLMSPTEIERRNIRIGTPPQFQGDERHVVFLSMVNVGEGVFLTKRDQELQRQRFNVAASRAQDQLWVVHSLNAQTELKAGDLRRSLIEHAQNPFAATAVAAQAKALAESKFETAVIERLERKGYGNSLISQFPVGAYRIDLVITGANGKRLAVECDGEKYHRPEHLEKDVARQADLERLGWKFVRIRGSAFYRYPDTALNPLFAELDRLDIRPIVETRPQTPGEDLNRRIRLRAAELLTTLDEKNLATTVTKIIRQSNYE